MACPTPPDGFCRLWPPQHAWFCSLRFGRFAARFLAGRAQFYDAARHGVEYSTCVQKLGSYQWRTSAALLSSASQMLCRSESQSLPQCLVFEQTKKITMGQLIGNYLNIFFVHNFPLNKWQLDTGYPEQVLRF